MRRVFDVHQQPLRRRDRLRRLIADGPGTVPTCASIAPSLSGSAVDSRPAAAGRQGAIDELPHGVRLGQVRKPQRAHGGIAEDHVAPGREEGDSVLEVLHDRGIVGATAGTKRWLLLRRTGHVRRPAAR